MKTLLSATAMFLALATQANADPVGFIGIFQVIANTGCSENRVGEDWNTRYRPQIAGNEENIGTRLNLFKVRSAHGYRLNQGRFNVGPDSAFKSVEAFAIGGNFGPIEPTPRIRFLNQNPATVDAKTPFITITGQMQNYDYDAGCTITFRATLTNDK